MRDPGLVLELRGEHEQLRAEGHEPTEELREPQVVADGHADPQVFDRMGDELRSRGERRRLAERRLAIEIDVEEMDLPIVGDQLSGPVEERSGVVDPVTVPFLDAPAQDPHPPLPCHLGQHRRGRSPGNGSATSGMRESGPR